MFVEAKMLSGHSDYVVIGSLSVLGLEESFEIPDAMMMSIDIACYTKADPRRIFNLAGDLGQNSAYHHLSGLYRDAVSPELPSLPDHWQVRLIKVERAGARACFLEANDAALSRYARGEPRDRQWIKAGLLAGVVSMPVVKSRLGTTNFTDHDEESKTRKLVGEDRLWFGFIQDQRKLTV